MGTIDNTPKDAGYQLLPQDPRALQAYPGADEISLVDLWLVLVRRKWLIFIACTLLTLLGLAYYLFVPKSYEYTTAVEIGTTLVEDSSGYTTKLIDPPETVLAKLNESYIPWVQHQYVLQHPEEMTFFKMNAVIPKQSELVVIKGKGSAENEAVYLDQLQQVLQRLFQDHERQTVIVRSALTMQLAQAREKLAALQDPSTLAVKKKSLEGELKTLQIRLDELRDPRIMALSVQKLETDLEQQKKALINLKNQEHLYQSQYRRLDQVDELLKKQIADLQAQIGIASQERQGTVNGIKDAGMAMAMLMIDNEIQKNRNRLAALEERLYITQKNEREKLLNKIEDNRREQAVQNKLITRLQGELEKLSFDNERQQAGLLPKIALTGEKITKLVADHQRSINVQQQRIQALETKLANMKQTRALIDPVRSLEPASPSGKIIMALALIMGLFIGIFAAFMAEFLAKARQQMRQETQKA